MVKRLLQAITMKKLPFFIAVLVLVFFSAATFSRNSVWKDSISLWEDAARKSPNKGRVHHNLGRAYDTHHMPGKAFQQYLIAVRVQPDLAKAHESLGISFVSIKAMDEARQELTTALRLDPGLTEARFFLDYISQQQAGRKPPASHQR